MSEYSRAKVDRWLADFQRLFIIAPEDIKSRQEGDIYLPEPVVFGSDTPRLAVPDHQAMVAYWALLAYDIPIPSWMGSPMKQHADMLPYAAQLCVDEGELTLNETWEEMSTWERANVLFGLIPIIEKCAAEAAKTVAAQARKEDAA